MVEHQPSKLDTWVRFPSPALFFIVTVQPVSAVVVGLFFVTAKSRIPDLPGNLTAACDSGTHLLSLPVIIRKEDVKSLCYTGFFCAIL